jgi:hypothetical protein
MKPPVTTAQIPSPPPHLATLETWERHLADLRKLPDKWLSGTPSRKSSSSAGGKAKAGRSLPRRGHRPVWAWPPSQRGTRLPKTPREIPGSSPRARMAATGRTKPYGAIWRTSASACEHTQPRRRISSLPPATSRQIGYGDPLPPKG